MKKLMMFALGVALSNNGLVKPAMRHPPRSCQQGSRLVLGSERPGVRLEFYSINPGTLPVEPSMRIRVRTSGRTAPIRALSDLKNLVHIANATQALKFVRLKTSLTTWYVWDSDNPEVEVVDSHQQLPDYGFGWESRIELEDALKKAKNRAKRHAPPQNEPSFDNSGFLGVLSSHAFAQGGFRAPKVVATPQGFVIERWILTTTLDGEHPQQRIKKLRETVTPEGGYFRTVLFEKAPPKLPNTHWDLPTRFL